MYQYIFIGEKAIGSYSLCAAIGLLIASWLTIKLLLEQLLVRRYNKLILLSLIGLAFGSKLFAVVSRILDIAFQTGEWNILEAITTSGNVFYGGLIGYLSFFYLVSKFQKKNPKEVYNILAVTMPLFHVFGRIGCYLGGCCYGKESNSYLAFPYRLGVSQSWVKRYPVQLWEAFAEFVFFLMLFIFYRRKIKNDSWSDGRLLELYLMMYSIMRFLLEFFRGDELRGVYGFLSFSQFVSIAIFIFIGGNVL